MSVGRKKFPLVESGLWDEIECDIRDIYINVLSVSRSKKLRKICGFFISPIMLFCGIHNRCNVYCKLGHEIVG